MLTLKALLTRRRIVAAASWAVYHRNSIFYSQARPIDYDFRKLPWSADCSGSTTAFYKDAGAPDPNGRNYDGSGYTGTMLSHLPHIAFGQARKGDLLVFGPGTGEHVVVFLQRVRPWRKDPLVETHRGNDPWPLSVPLSTEIAHYGASTPRTCLKGVPDRY